ncbi:MAG: nicotinate-nucleotide--dimethylbenzimidazole phosphoribosyltransferase [Coriobacteriia bacterium]|nr:nicotinate-nucleotide--dimethylbenzimidazole phosphoribosyltransferase [Coriobacteriia bacterium]
MAISLTDTLNQIEALSPEVLARAQARQDILIKPQGSLGVLEELGVRLAAIQNTLKPQLDHAEIHTFAADHGSAQAGVSAFSQAVTAQMISGIADGVAGVSLIANTFGIAVRPYDVGIVSQVENARVIQRKIMPGTHNMHEEDAMSRSQAIQALELGINEAIDAIENRKVSALGLGEVGIGNTTSAAAIISVFTGLEPELVTGRGTGLDDEGLSRKIAFIKETLDERKPNAQDGLDVLSKIGGLEIAAMAGTVLGAASRRTAVVVDGVISCAATLIALSLAPKAKDYIFASHNSEEPGCKRAFDYMGLSPYLDLRMRLGEGTGAALGIAVMRAAANVMSNMASFDEAGVSNKE